MKTASILLLIFCLSTLLFAQPPDTLWTRGSSFDFNHMSGLDCASPLPDGGFYVSGRCCYSMYMHYFWVAAFVARMDQNGYPVWSWSSPLGAEAYEIRVLPDGGCVAGAAMGIGVLCLEPTIIRFSPGGQGQWMASPEPNNWWYGTDTVAAVCRLDGGGFAATGLFGDSSYVFRTDSSGQILWSRSFYPTRLLSIAAATDTGCVVAGADVFFLARLNSVGDTIWTRHFMVGPYSECRRVIASPSGNYLMIGGSGEVSYSGAAAMVSPQGERLWSQFYTFSHEFIAGDRCAEGGYILLSDRLVRINEDGDTLWTRTFPCESCTYKSVTQTADSGYVVAGYSGDRWSGDGYLVKFTREGLSADPHFILHPSSFILSAFPNPFNPTTTLSFTLLKAGRTKVVVYDITGREVRTLSDEMLNAGEHRIAFDGSSLPSGIYFARLRSGEFIATRKLLLLK